MTVYVWPAKRKHIPQEARLRSVTNGRANDSTESGATQTATRPGSKWGWSITMPGQREAVRDDFEGFLIGLSGRQHRIRAYDWKHPRPRGTCNLTGVTLSSSAAQFATSVVLAGCGASKTLLRGDWIGFASGQLCKVVIDATADGSGVMTVEVRHSLRSAINSGTAVTLDKPTALYILADATIEVPRGPGPCEQPFGFDIIEVFS